MKIVFKILRKISQMIRMQILKLEDGNSLQVGKNFSFRNNFSLRIKETGKIIIGENVFFNNGASLNAIKEIRIGNNCIFGENVKIYDHNHKYKDDSMLISKQGYSSKTIIIGDNCWIGSNVVILPGVKIGSNSVIGAGCIIYKDISCNTLVKNKQELMIEEIIREK